MLSKKTISIIVVATDKNNNILINIHINLDNPSHNINVLFLPFYLQD